MRNAMKFTELKTKLDPALDDFSTTIPQSLRCLPLRPKRPSSACHHDRISSFSQYRPRVPSCRAPPIAVTKEWLFHHMRRNRPYGVVSNRPASAIFAWRLHQALNAGGPMRMDRTVEL